MKNKERLAYGHYFQFVYYPQDRQDISQLYLLGMLHFSPMHNAKCKTQEQAKNNWLDYYNNHNKPHYHVMIHSNRKMTENTFIQAVCEILHGDLSGIAIVKGKCYVEDTTAVLRYYLHLDIPTKEHFNLADSLQGVTPTFAKDCAKAYDAELSYIVQTAIYLGKATTLEDIIFMWGNENWILSAWLKQGKNSYIVNSMLNDKRFKERRLYQC